MLLSARARTPFQEEAFEDCGDCDICRGCQHDDRASDCDSDEFFLCPEDGARRHAAPRLVTATDLGRELRLIGAIKAQSAAK